MIDLGGDGVAVVAVCSTVNFALRTPAEQESLVAAFGRYLHSLTAPVQILIRAERLDLSAQIAELRQRARALPHPALEAAAREHADYLAPARPEHADLLRRQVLLVLREPLAHGRPAEVSAAAHRCAAGAARAAAQRAGPETTLPRAPPKPAWSRRLGEAVELLGPVGDHRHPAGRRAGHRRAGRRLQPRQPAAAVLRRWPAPTKSSPPPLRAGSGWPSAQDDSPDAWGSAKARDTP